jgi:hypothetical protein
MGGKCNSRYKLNTDIIQTPRGRRRAFFPYGAGFATVSLLNSVPFAGDSPVLPQWQITFAPQNEEVGSWKDVFEIEVRYRRDELNPRFDAFLREFRNWCRTAPGVPFPPTEDQIPDLLDRFAQNMEFNGKADRAFLKAAVFKMLHQKCVDGNTRLLEFLRDFLAGPPAIN